MRFRTMLVLLFAALLTVPGDVASSRTAAPPTPAQIIAKLNAQRKANGIPGGIQAKSEWNQDCKKHDHYMDVNDTLTHFEVQGNPGYTAGGSFAGQNSVLSMGATWRDGNPFEFAPIHLAQMLQPRLNVSGAYELTGKHGLWGCTITLAGYKRKDPASNRIYTYPGDRRSGVNHDYAANELPVTPNKLVGAPEHCGQELFVFASGPALTAGTSPNPYTFDVTQAKLRPAGGTAVRVKIADALVKMPASVGGGLLGYYLGPGTAIIIPVKPLEPATKYVASVTMKGNGVTLKHTWSFTTKK